ncbi:MAG: AAA family ATPase [Acidobacteriota bacterium]
MSQIKKLELVGFKSFCDRTNIPFSPGITAIVGPNGCGKSNIADAISWVVGAQSTKSLRTDKMAGIIFNGTEKRKATGSENFTVGRRLYRSGESEYYLDGRRCRLKDIQAIFEGTGLGPNSYAIMEQGRIGQILSSKPAERRSLIEEAARITLFKSRRYSAEMKLEMAQQNLLRAQDIIREVVRQLNSLRRQAAKARRYNRLREELRSVHRLKIGMEDRRLREKLTECSSRLEAAQEREQSILLELENAKQSRQSIWNTCCAQEESVNQARDRLSSLKMDVGNAQNMLGNQETQKLGLIARSNELVKEKSAIEERSELIQHEIERLTRMAEDLDTELSRKNVQARCQEILDRISISRTRLENEREVKSQEHAAKSDELENTRKQYETKAARLGEISSSCDDLETRLGELSARLEQVSAEMSEQVNEQGLLQHRFSSLEEVERRRSNYSDGVQKYLSTKIPGEEECRAKTLADYIETDPAYETALESYLNDPLQYILVENRKDAVHSIDRLKRIGAGKCTFLTIQNGHSKHTHQPRPELKGEGIVGYLDDLLQMDPEVKHAFERALPEYASTIMVSDLNTAFRVSEKSSGGSFLTLSGESYSPRGTLSAIGEQKSVSGFLALKREKRELERKLTKLQNRIQATREEHESLKNEQESTGESLKVLSAESRSLEVETALSRQEIIRLESELEKIGQAENVAASELTQLADERCQVERRLNEAAVQIGEIEKRSGHGTEELQELNTRLQSLRSDSAALMKELGTLTSAHAVKQERRTGMDSDLRRLGAESEEALRRIETNRSETAICQRRVQELEIAQQEVRTRIADCNRNIEVTGGMLEEKQQELTEQRETLANMEEKLRQFQASREGAMDSRNKIEIEKARLESDLEHLNQNCLEEFRLPIQEVLSDIPDSDWEREYSEVAESCNKIRQTVENFGGINMRALEEYQELDQRYQFLNGQRLDIEKSIEDTRKAISEINRRSIEQFGEAFKAIRQHFQEVFQMLFDGGQCDLKLLDEGDILESGIDIIAQPPGKHLQNVLLLSGGEKALTALALLIAIFRYRPSPVCVLDEVDAPLDDANINRFTRMISELSQNTQFIIITHNKNTMEIARTLYGITMEEPGISKVIGVDFRQHQEALAS